MTTPGTPAWLNPSASGQLSNRHGFNAPSVGLALSASGSGSALVAGQYSAGYTWYFASTGETAMSPATSITVTAGQNVVTQAIPNVPAGVTSVRFYISQAPSGGTTGFVGSNAAGASLTITSNGTASIQPPSIGPDAMPLSILYTNPKGSADPIGMVRCTATRTVLQGTPGFAQLAWDSGWVGANGAEPLPIAGGASTPNASCTFSWDDLTDGDTTGTNTNRKTSRLYFATSAGYILSCAIAGVSLGPFRYEQTPTSATTGSPIALQSLQALNGRLYGNAANAIYSAQIMGDYTLTAWRQESNSAPSSHGNYCSLTGYSDRKTICWLLVCGGSTTDCHYCLVDLRSGRCGAWSQTTSLPAKRKRHGCSYHPGCGYVFVTGGDDDTNCQSTVWSCPVTQANGSLGTWQTLNALPAARHNHGHSICNGDIYVSGGASAINDADDSKYATNTVYYASINCGAGTVSTWSVSSNGLPISLSGGNTQGSDGGYLITLGGFSATISITNTYSSSATTPGANGPWTSGSVPPLTASALGTGGSLTTNGDGSQTLVFQYGAMGLPATIPGFLDGDQISLQAWTTSLEGEASAPASLVLKIGQPPTVANPNPAGAIPNGQPTCTFGYAAGAGGGAETSWQAQVITAEGSQTLLFDSGVRVDQTNQVVLGIAPYFSTGTTYQLTITVTAGGDTPVPGSTNVGTYVGTFTPQYQQPPTPGSFSATVDNQNALVNLAWTNPQSPVIQPPLPAPVNATSSSALLQGQYEILETWVTSSGESPASPASTVTLQDQLPQPVQGSPSPPTPPAYVLQAAAYASGDTDADNDGGGAQTQAKPQFHQATTSGTTLVAFVGCDKTSQTFTAPSGWSSVGTAPGGSNDNQSGQCFIYPNNPGGITNPVFTRVAGSGGVCGAIAEVTGVIASPLDSSGFSSTNASAAPSAGSVTSGPTTQTNDLALAAWVQVGEDLNTSTFTPGTGWNLTQSAANDDIGVSLVSAQVSQQGTVSASESWNVAANAAQMVVTLKTPTPPGSGSVSVVSGTSTLPTGAFAVGYTIVTPSGESTVASLGSATITSANAQQLQIAAISGLASNVTSINLYLTSTPAIQIALVGSTGALVTGTTSVTGTWGAGQSRTANDLLTAQVTAWGSNAITAPSGWTGIGSEVVSGSARTRVFYRIATGSDAAPTFTSTSASFMSIQIDEWSGNSTSSPVATSGSSTGTGTSVTVTTSGNVPQGGCLTLTSWLQYNSSSNSATTSAGSGYSRLSNNSGSASNYHASSDYLINPTTGTTSAETETISTSATNGAAQIVVFASLGTNVASGFCASAAVTSGTSAVATISAPGNGTAPPSSDGAHQQIQIAPITVPANVTSVKLYYSQVPVGMTTGLFATLTPSGGVTPQLTTGANGNGSIIPSPAATANRLYYRPTGSTNWILYADNITALAGVQQTFVAMDELTFSVAYDFAVSALSPVPDEGPLASVSNLTINPLGFNEMIHVAGQGALYHAALTVPTYSSSTTIGSSMQPGVTITANIDVQQQLTYGSRAPIQRYGVYNYHDVSLVSIHQDAASFQAVQQVIRQAQATGAAIYYRSMSGTMMTLAFQSQQAVAFMPGPVNPVRFVQLNFTEVLDQSSAGTTQGYAQGIPQRQYGDISPQSLIELGL